MTGHGLFTAHLSKWKLLDPICNLCLEDDESADHLWNTCPALARERMLRDIEYPEKKSNEVRMIEFFEIKSIKEMMKENSSKCGQAVDRTMP